MTGCNHIGAVGKRRFQKELELNLLVTQDIGIRRTAGGVLVHHHIDHVLLVLRLKVEHFERDIKLGSHGFGVSKILAPRTLDSADTLGPILHVNTDYSVALTGE